MDVLVLIHWLTECWLTAIYTITNNLHENFNQSGVVFLAENAVGNIASKYKLFCPGPKVLCQGPIVVGSSNECSMPLIGLHIKISVAGQLVFSDKNFILSRSARFFINITNAKVQQLSYNGWFKTRSCPSWLMIINNHCSCCLLFCCCIHHYNITYEPLSGHILTTSKCATLPVVACISMMRQFCE